MPWMKGRKPTEQEITDLDRATLKEDWNEICRLACIGAASEERERRDWTQETERLKNYIDECRFLLIDIGKDTQKGDALFEAMNAAELWRQYLLKEEEAKDVSPIGGGEDAREKDNTDE